MKLSSPAVSDIFGAYANFSGKESDRFYAQTLDETVRWATARYEESGMTTTVLVYAYPEGEDTGALIVVFNAV